MSNMGRTANIFGIVLAIIMLCGGSAFISYVYGHNKGYDACYEAEQKTNYTEGYTTGKQDGYDVGYNVGYKAGLEETISGYNLRDPNYQDMKDFLSQDTTDSIAYVDGEYVCTDFSAAVNNNAESHGFRCAMVDIWYPEGYGHNIIAFDTTDRGLIFIEPQFDQEVKLITGKSYSEINNFTQPPRDDTIQRFLVSW